MYFYAALWNLLSEGDLGTGKASFLNAIIQY